MAEADRQCGGVQLMTMLLSFLSVRFPLAPVQRDTTRYAFEMVQYLTFQVQVRDEYCPMTEAALMSDGTSLGTQMAIRRCGQCGTTLNIFMAELGLMAYPNCSLQVFIGICQYGSLVNFSVK